MFMPRSRDDLFRIAAQQSTDWKHMLQSKPHEGERVCTKDPKEPIPETPNESTLAQSSSCGTVNQ
ncbi:MAG: hypothetical protein HUU55_03290 [Myxococcales bacterium]|nr:hypothetical protein [Myxococcales bacterium]